MLTKILEKIGRKRVIKDRYTDEDYIERYYLLFSERQSKIRWFPFNILLHHICKSDPSDLHDHPWNSLSIILKGGYWEHTPYGRFWRGRWSVIPRKSIDQHRLEIDKEKANGETWSLFIVGIRVRDWGFILPDGKWVQWEKYLDLQRSELE